MAIKLRELTIEEKEKAATMLQTVAELELFKRPVDKKGYLDVKKFNEMDEIKKLKAQLLKLKINKPVLDKNGFIVAAMILEDF